MRQVIILRLRKHLDLDCTNNYINIAQVITLKVFSYFDNSYIHKTCVHRNP